MALGERLPHFLAWHVAHICLVLLCQNSPGDGFLKVHDLSTKQMKSLINVLGY